MSDAADPHSNSEEGQLKTANDKALAWLNENLYNKDFALLELLFPKIKVLVDIFADNKSSPSLEPAFFEEFNKILNSEEGWKTTDKDQKEVLVILSFMLMVYPFFEQWFFEEVAIEGVIRDGIKTLYNSPQLCEQAKQALLTHYKHLVQDVEEIVVNM